MSDVGNISEFRQLMVSKNVVRLVSDGTESLKEFIMAFGYSHDGVQMYFNYSVVMRVTESTH